MLSTTGTGTACQDCGKVVMKKGSLRCWECYRRSQRKRSRPCPGCGKEMKGAAARCWDCQIERQRQRLCQDCDAPVGRKCVRCPACREKFNNRPAPQCPGCGGPMSARHHALCFECRYQHAEPREPGKGPGAPTAALPGTEEKVAVLAARFAAREGLWHPADAEPRAGRVGYSWTRQLFRRLGEGITPGRD